MAAWAQCEGRFHRPALHLNSLNPKVGGIEVTEEFVAELGGLQGHAQRILVEVVRPAGDHSEIPGEPCGEQRGHWMVVVGADAQMEGVRPGTLPEGLPVASPRVSVLNALAMSHEQPTRSGQACVEPLFGDGIGLGGEAVGVALAVHDGRDLELARCVARCAVQPEWSMGVAKRAATAARHLH